MWTHSFWSVLVDLWAFFWRLDAKAPISDSKYTASTQQPVAPTQAVVQRPITLDTQQPKIVKLQAGTVYTSESIETILLRAALKSYDTHLVLTGNLQLIEWLLYNIYVRNPDISLLALKMTPLGRWYQTIKSLPGTRVGIEPATGSLMEWHDAAQQSHAALVDVVAPDNTISISSISQDPSGTRVEQTMSESVWKELRPVFTCFH